MSSELNMPQNRISAKATDYKYSTTARLGSGENQEGARSATPDRSEKTPYAGEEPETQITSGTPKNSLI